MNNAKCWFVGLHFLICISFLSLCLEVRFSYNTIRFRLGWIQNKEKREKTLHMSAIEAGEVTPKDTNISTHVLDTATGLPAGGLKIQLRVCTNTLEFTGEEELFWEEIAVTQTDNDGRGRFVFDIQPGIYQMRFYTTAYFTNAGVKNFYPLVEVTFRITDVSRHHHVPLLLSPFGFSTYRGS